MVDLAISARGSDARVVAVGEIIDGAETSAIETTRQFLGFSERSQTPAKSADDVTTLAPAAPEVLIRRWPPPN